MSSATPAAFLSAMSITTTSASCLSAVPRATVAPTFPAPPTTVTLRFIVAPRVTTINAETAEPAELQIALYKKILRVPRVLRCLSSHVRDDVVAELGRLELGCAVHQAREVVGDALGRDRPFHPLDEEVRH